MKRRHYVDTVLDSMGFYQSVRDVCIGKPWNITTPRGKEDHEEYKALACNLRELVNGIGKTIQEKGLDYCYNRAVSDGIAHAFSNHIRNRLQDDVVCRHMDGNYTGYLQSLGAFVEIIPAEEICGSSII